MRADRFFKKILLRAAVLCGAVLLSAAPEGMIPAPVSSFLQAGSFVVHAESVPTSQNDVMEDGWPEAPDISAEGAIVLDAETGAVLYGRNIHEHLYPASTTKMLTCLIAAENLDMDDTVTFSYEAVHSVPSDGSSIGMDEGESLTVKECLYAIMVGSANECANAVAEKTAGSISAFVDMMNERAVQLGCTDSHFVTTNGLFDEDHYTSPYDLALIARAFFNCEALSSIGNTPNYHLSPSATQPDDIYLHNKHALITGETPCTGVIGGKTGYTDEARETLVTGCRRNGMTLICVVMKEESPDQFLDSVSLLNYAYSSFSRVNASENDTAHKISAPDFQSGGTDLLGSSVPALSIPSDAYIDLPNDAAFSDLTSTVGSDNTITYYYGNNMVGTASAEASSDLTVSSAAENTSVRTISLLDTGDESGSSGNLLYGSTVSSVLTKLLSLPLLGKICSIYAAVGNLGTIYLNLAALIRTIAVILLGLLAFILILMIINFIRTAGKGPRRNTRSNRKNKNISLYRGPANMYRDRFNDPWGDL